MKRNFEAGNKELLTETHAKEKNDEIEHGDVTEAIGKQKTVRRVTAAFKTTRHIMFSLLPKQIKHVLLL